MKFFLTAILLISANNSYATNSKCVNISKKEIIDGVEMQELERCIAECSELYVQELVTGIQDQELGYCRTIQLNLTCHRLKTKEVLTGVQQQIWKSCVENGF